MNSAAIAISVLVRTFNSEKTLARLLSRLDLQPGDELVVVDSGSTDRTLAVAGKHSARIVRTSPPFNYSKSLNAGFREARNSWVLVISSHAVPLIPNLIETYRRAFEKLPKDVVVAYGPSYSDGHGYDSGKDGRVFTEKDYRNVLDCCGNANTLYRRSIWEQIPFDESIRTQEDKEWLQKAMESGNAMTLLSAPRTINRNAYSLRYMYRKGYSDVMAAEHRAIPPSELALAMASHVKRYLTTAMPFGNLLRALSHQYGVFWGSRQPQDNSPRPPQKF